MALVLVATPGSASANTYATLEEAETYMAKRLHKSTWTAADDGDKNIALAMACDLLDTLWEWKMFPADKTQALEWPRSGVWDKLKLSIIPDDEIPQLLKEAQVELAFQLLPEDRTLDYDVEAKGIRAFTAGPVSFTFKNGVTAKVIPDAVKNKIPRHWGHLKGSGVNKRLERS